MGTSYCWQYDLEGNRTQQIANGVTTSCTINAADQLTAVNSAAVSTDANGIVTQDETGGVYSWDVRGRLKGLTRSGITSLFGYNADDLRVSKTVSGVQTTYLLDGESVVQEKSSGATTDLLQGPGIDNLLERGGIWQTPNALGSPTITLDGNGLQSYFYAPFGQITVWGSGAPLPYQFTGREADESGLMYYRARYYNPNWGRFVSRDPLGVGGLADVALLHTASSGAGPGLTGHPEDPSLSAAALFGPDTLGAQVGADTAVNPYAYADDNPITRVDPSGKTELPAALANEMAELDSEGPQGQEVAAALLAAWLSIEAGSAMENAIGNAASDAWNYVQNLLANVPSRKIGPSGAPMIHIIRYPTKKGAFEGAKQGGRGGDPIHHPNPANGDDPHYHPNDGSGDVLKDGTHHVYPK